MYKAEYIQLSPTLKISSLFFASKVDVKLLDLDVVESVISRRSMR